MVTQAQVDVMRLARIRMTRRTFVIRLAGSAALGITTLAVPRSVGAIWAQEGLPGPIRVRMGEVLQAGADFRGGLAEGVRVPGIGGAFGLTPERPGARFTSEPLKLDFACSHIGAHWRADGPIPELIVEVRSSRNGQAWTPWRRALVEAHGRDSSWPETYGALMSGQMGLWLQYRVIFPHGGPETPAIEQMGLTYLDAGNSPGRAPSGVSTMEAGGGPGSFLDRVVTREQWSADESIRFVDGADQWPRAFVAPKFLVVHHTAGDNEYADPAAQVRAIYTYHTVTQGWGDIGYHLLIDNRGQAFEGRIGRGADTPDREIVSRDVVAGHAFGYNYGSSGIALLGTFTDVQPTQAALSTLEEALAFEASRHALDPLSRVDFLRARSRTGDNDLWRDDLAAVSGHRDCVRTECPGDQLYALLESVIHRVAERIGPPGPRAQIVRAPADRSAWPSDVVFNWQSGEDEAEFSTRLEGFRLSDQPDRIVPLSGYTADEQPAWSPWSEEPAAAFALPPDARGSYTFYVRARTPGGEGLYTTRWPLFVDRHVLADNRDERNTARRGDWQRSANILGYNGADYETAEPAGAAATFAWMLDVPESGTYRVLGCWPEGDIRASNAHFTISAGGPPLAEARVDQQERGGVWVELARVPLQAGAVCRVELDNQADSVVVADAVRLVLV